MNHNDIAELERKISQQQALLSMYEGKQTLEDDPRRMLKLQEEVEQTKILILGYQTKMAELRPADAPRRPSRHLLQPNSLLLANAPYGLETELVGRKAELALLDDWYQHEIDRPFLAVIGLGGIGKSALTWHWLQQLQRQGQAPPLVVWWSFYETDGTMDKMLAAVLTYFGDDPRQFPSLRAAVERFLNRLRQNPTLLILDGAERLLRAYGSLGAAYQGDDPGDGPPGAGARQCLDPATGTLLSWLAQPHLTQAMTLMSSRMLPQELTGRSGGLLAGVRRHDLTGLSLTDAQELFRQAGVQASRGEVQAVGEPLGYHPLSLRLLAQYAANDPRYQGDIRAAVNYDPYPELLGKRQHVLRRAYDCLPDTAQQLLSRLAAFRGGVAWETAAAVMGDNDQLRRDLRRLEERGLLQRATQTGAARYDLHPIVRRYAYDRLLNGAEIHDQLANYFEAVPQPTKVQTLADLQPVIEQYHHLTRCGRYDAAFELFHDRLGKPLYYQLGAYQTVIELLQALFPDGEDKPPRLQDERDQAWTLNTLAVSHSLAGRPAAAVPLFEQHNAIQEKQGNKKNLAAGLGNLAHMAQIHLGQLTAAANNLRRSIELCQEIEDRLREAVGRQEYGRLLALCGNGAGATQELERALELAKEVNEIQNQGLTWAYRALAALLQGDGRTAQTAAQEALRLADEDAHTSYPVERDYVQAYWLLGWAALLNDDQAAAQNHLDEALRRCRAINNVESEPAILLAQARLARAVGPEASLPANLAAEARLIAERSGYRLELADIHNFLAQLALDKGDKAAARDHAQQAYDYALCDGPPYAYQSALDEATRLLGGEE